MALFTDEPEQLKAYKWYKPVTNTLEWTQCLAIYIAEFCKKTARYTQISHFNISDVHVPSWAMIVASGKDCLQSTG